MTDYALIDSGRGEKLERFGEVTLIRPCAHALWHPRSAKSVWKQAHARFSREEGNQWEIYKPFPQTWEVCIEKIMFKLKATSFGHLGIFPEHQMHWRWIRQQIVEMGFTPQILNLFAYSGGATLAAASENASVSHVDAAKGMVEWARENAALNGLEKCPVRWIVEDVKKYLGRAFRREIRYDAIVLDPPTFGRGRSKEVFKIERDILNLLESCVALLSKRPRFLLLSCHTPGFTPLVLKQLLIETTLHLGGRVESGEMALPGPVELPSGTFARWIADAH
ncbi:MAG: class I SAM-dependent methyltransferase [Chlamydiales bacterium]